MGRCFHFLLLFLLRISTRENKIKILLWLSQKSLWNGRKNMKEFGAFYKSKLTQFIFLCHHLVSQSFRLSPTAREQTPSQIIPEERVLLSPKGHPERGMTC